MSDAVSACAEIVHKADPDRFSAIMAAPLAMRETLFPMHAFAIEVARAPWVTQEPMIAEMRLQWWRDAIEEIASGAPVRKHEVVTPLAGFLKPETAHILDGFIEMRRWDIYKDPFEDAAHFQSYLTQTGGVFYRAIAQCFGDRGDAAEQFGFGVAVANWLVAVPELEQRGRVPLLDGRPEGVKALAEMGINAIRSAAPGIPGKLRPAMLTGWQAKPILHQVLSDPTCVADGRIGQSAFRKKSSLLWKALSGRL